MATAAHYLLPLAVCLLISGWTLSAPTGAKPTPCCLPEQWEGLVSSLQGQVKDGQGQSFMTGGSLHIDTKNKRFASFQTVETQGRRVNVTVVELTDVMYVIVPAIKSCLKQPPAPINNCIPSNAEYVNTQVLGKSSGSDSIRADLWGVHVTTGMDVYARTLITHDGCLPLFQSTLGSVGGTDVTRADNFFDIHAGIRDPGVFSVPDYCKQSPMVVMDHNVMSLISHHRARRATFN